MPEKDLTGMIIKTRDLCGKCAALLGEAYTLQKVAQQVNQKITCDNCGKRRYGATYAVGGKKKEIGRL